MFGIQVRSKCVKLGQIPKFGDDSRPQVSMVLNRAFPRGFLPLKGGRANSSRESGTE